MKEVKLFEVRDAAMAVQIINECTDADDYLMGITGYGYRTK